MAPGIGRPIDPGLTSMIAEQLPNNRLASGFID